jgi:hypothetical protein
MVSSYEIRKHINNFKEYEIIDIIKELKESFIMFNNANIQLKKAINNMYTKDSMKAYNEYRMIKNYYNKSIINCNLIAKKFYKITKQNKMINNLYIKNNKFNKFIELILDPLIKKDNNFVRNNLKIDNKKIIFKEDELYKQFNYYKNKILT